MRRGRAGLITLLVIVALVLYALGSLASTRSQIERYALRADELLAEVNELERENAALEYETRRSSDDEMIEYIARNRLGLVYPGEVIFYDTGD